MLGWFKRKLRYVSETETIASQPPGEIFAWPKGAVLTAIDEIVFALPMALFGEDRTIGDCVFGQDDMEINIPMDGDTFLLRVRPGMSVSLAQSCQSYIVAEDGRPRRAKVRQPPSEK